jgi:hypothetical protein
MIHFYFIVRQYFRCIGGYNKKLHPSITWSFQLYSTILLWVYADEILRGTSWSWWISIEIRCMKWIYGVSKNLNESFLFFIYYLFCFNSLMMNWERKKIQIFNVAISCSDYFISQFSILTKTYCVGVILFLTVIIEEYRFLPSCRANDILFLNKE